MYSSIHVRLLTGHHAIPYTPQYMYVPPVIVRRNRPSTWNWNASFLPHPTQITRPMPSSMETCSHTPDVLVHTLADGCPTEHRGHSRSCNSGLPRDDIPSHPIPCMGDPSSHPRVAISHPHTHSCRPSHHSRPQHGIGQYPRRVMPWGRTTYASISAMNAHLTSPAGLRSPTRPSSPPENR